VVKLLLATKADVTAVTDKLWRDGIVHCDQGKGRGLGQTAAGGQSDANVEDKLGRLVAVPYGNKKVVKLLLGGKADVNLKASCNRICSCSWKVMTALCLAAYKGDEAMVKLLLEAKADVYERESERAMALCIAAKEGHVAVVKLLLETKVGVNLKGIRHGWMALLIAAENGPVDYLGNA